MTARVLLTLALAAATAGGCTSQWYLQHDQSDLVTTNVVVRSDPPGADVRTDAVSHGSAPVRIPIEYHHTEQLWSRQQSQGTSMRESMHPVLQVLTFPVWGVASFFHYREDRRRHVYSNNTVHISAVKPGYGEAVQRVALEGQDEIEVFLSLERN